MTISLPDLPSDLIGVALRLAGKKELGQVSVLDVRLAVLEVDGSVSVITAAGPESRTAARLRRHRPNQPRSL